MSSVILACENHFVSMIQTRQVDARLRGDTDRGITRFVDTNSRKAELRPFLHIEVVQDPSGFDYRSTRGLPPGEIGIGYRPGDCPDNTRTGGLAWGRIPLEAADDPKWIQLATGFTLTLAISATTLGFWATEGSLGLEGIPAIGRTRVLLGSYKGLGSPVCAGRAVTCLEVTLEPHERWTYQPQTGHNVVWLFPFEGYVQVGNHRSHRDLVVFKSSEGLISARAEGDGARIVVGTAVRSR